MLVVYSHECFLRLIQGATNIERSWALSKSAFSAQPLGHSAQDLSRCSTFPGSKHGYPPKMSQLHGIAEDVFVIHDPQVSVADSEFLRWEMKRNGIHFQFIDEVVKIDPPSRRPERNESQQQHHLSCSTCFIQEDPWAQEQIRQSEFGERSDDFLPLDDQLSASVSFAAAQHPSIQAYQPFTSNVGKMELMKAYIKTLEIALAQKNQDRPVLLLSDAVLMRQDLEDQFRDNSIIQTSKPWEILLLGSYWWENITNPSDNPVLQGKEKTERTNNSTSDSLQVLNERANWSLDVLQPCGFSSPLSLFAMVLRSRAVQETVLEFFQECLTQRVNAFQTFHVWANREFEHHYFLTAPNLFMPHVKYDEVGHNVKVTQRKAQFTQFTTESSLKTTHSFKNYTKEDFNYWNIDDFLRLNPQSTALSLLPSTLSPSPVSMQLPFVNVCLIVEYRDDITNSIQTLSSFTRSVSSLLSQTYPNLQITCFYPNIWHSSIQRQIDDQLYLMSAVRSGRLCVKKFDPDVLSSVIQSYVSDIQRSQISSKRQFLLIDTADSVSLPTRVETLVNCLIRLSTRSTSSSSSIPTLSHTRCCFHLIAKNKSHSQCIKAEPSRSSFCTSVHNFEDAFLKGMNHQNGFMKEMQAWVNQTIDASEVISQILSMTL